MCAKLDLLDSIQFVYQYQAQNYLEFQADTNQIDKSPQKGGLREEDFKQSESYFYYYPLRTDLDYYLEKCLFKRSDFGNLQHAVN